MGVVIDVAGIEKKTRRELDRFSKVYPILIETQMLLDKPRASDPPPNTLLRVALKAEIGELFNALKPHWAWWKRQDKTFEDDGTYLEEAADVMHFALALDIRALWEMHLTPIAQSKTLTIPSFDEFSIREARPLAEKAAVYYAESWPANQALKDALLIYEECRLKRQSPACKPLTRLIKYGKVTLQVSSSHNLLLPERFYAELIALAGGDTERLVDAYFSKAKKNLQRWGRSIPASLEARTEKGGKEDEQR